MRRKLIAGNWKMYKTVAETVKYVKEFRALVKDVTGVEIVLATPFTALHAAAEAARPHTGKTVTARLSPGAAEVDLGGTRARTLAYNNLRRLL